MPIRKSDARDAAVAMKDIADALGRLASTDPQLGPIADHADTILTLGKVLVRSLDDHAAAIRELAAAVRGGGPAP